MAPHLTQVGDKDPSLKHGNTRSCSYGFVTLRQLVLGFPDMFEASKGRAKTIRTDRAVTWKKSRRLRASKTLNMHACRSEHERPGCKMLDMLACWGIVWKCHIPSCWRRHLQFWLPRSQTLLLSLIPPGEAGSLSPPFFADFTSYWNGIKIIEYRKLMQNYTKLIFKRKEGGFSIKGSHPEAVHHTQAKNPDWVHCVGQPIRLLWRSQNAMWRVSPPFTAATNALEKISHEHIN